MTTGRRRLLALGLSRAITSTRMATCVICALGQPVKGSGPKRPHATKMAIAR